MSDGRPDRSAFAITAQTVGAVAVGAGGRPRPRGSGTGRAPAARPDSIVLSDRDMDIVWWTRRLRHVRWRQYRELVFHQNKSDYPCDRRLKFLVDNNFLHKSKQTVDDGGGLNNVYRLALEGHRLFHGKKKFEPDRQHVKHSLQVGYRVVELYQLHRAGTIRLDNLEFEPDYNHVYVNGVRLDPDLIADVTVPGYGSLPLWHEVDTDNEGDRVLRRKIAAYAKALREYSEADRELVPVFPFILWVCPDRDRIDRIRDLVNERREERERDLFRYTTFNEYARYISTDLSSESLDGGLNRQSGQT